MIVTKEWIERWFGEFNRLYFSSGLPMPIIVLSRARTTLGQMGWKQARQRGSTRFYDFTLKMSTAFDFTERQAQNVLLHEMIHYSIAYTGLKDTAPHGVVWRGMADALNRRYGWNITATSRQGTHRLACGTTATHRRATPQGGRLVAILTLRDGRHMATVVQPSYRAAVDSRLRRAPLVAQVDWYRSSDAYFDRFPAVRTPRACRIDDATLSRLQPAMQPA